MLVCIADPSVAVHRMRALDGSLSVIPPLARECVLSFITVYALSEEFGREAAHFFSDHAWGEQLVAKVHARDEKNRLVVTVYQDGNDVSVNEQIVAAGVGRVSRTASRKVDYRLERGQPGADKDKVGEGCRALHCDQDCHVGCVGS